MTELALGFFLVHITLHPHLWAEIKKRLKHPLIITAGVFAIIFVFTSLISINPSYSFWSNFERAEGGWQILHYVTFFILTSLLITTKKQWVNLLRFLVVVSMGVVGYALGQYFDISGFLAANITTSGTLGNASYLGGFLIFMLFFMGWLYTQEKSKTIKIILGIIALIDLWMFYESQTASAVGALGIGGIILALMYSYRRHLRYSRHNKKHLIIHLIVNMLGVAFILTGSTYIIYAFKNGDVLGSLHARFWTWKSAIAGILEKPFTGWGMENFPYVFDKYYNPNHYGIESWFDRAHNIALEYLVAGGIILFVAYLTLYIVYYLKLASFAQTTTEGSEAYAWTPLLVIMPIVYLIQGSTIFEILSFYLMLFLLFSFCLNFTEHFRDVNLISSRPMRWSYLTMGTTTLIAIIIGTSLFYTIYRPLRKNILIIQSNNVNNISLEEALSRFNTALEYPSVIGQDELEGNFFLFSVNVLEIIEKENSSLLKNPAFVKQFADINKKWFHPDRYAGLRNYYIYNFMLFKLAVLAHNDQLLEEAKKIAQTGEKRAPTRLEFLDILAKIAAVEQDKKEIERIQKKIKQLRPDLDITKFIPTSTI